MVQRSTELLRFDPDAMVVALQDGVLEHVQLESGVFNGRIAHTALPYSRVDWGSYTVSVLARGDLPRDMVTLLMAVSGQGEWRMHGRPANCGDLYLFPEGGEVLATLPQQAQWLALHVPRARLEHLGLPLGRMIDGSATGLGKDDKSDLIRLLGDLAPAIGPGACTAFADAALGQAHDQLLSGLFGALARSTEAAEARVPVSPGERLRVVRRAEEFLATSGEPTARIDDLCVAANSSLSRLERAFRDTFGVGPRRYLTLRRLAAVRRELLNRDADVTVTEVATRWGFFHLGRFSQEYRLLYQEQPSETLRTGRRVG